MASHPSDQQSPRSEGNVRRSLRESMNMSNGPASRPPLEESEESEKSASMLAALQDKPEEAAQDDPEEIARLQEESDHLRHTLEELRQQLEQVGGDAQPGWGEREREYEDMLEQKSETIRELNVRLQELSQDGGGGAHEPAASAAPANVNQDELANLSDEIERERCQLEQERRRSEDDRRQLRDDEDSMMRQMREMELQMAKERAELARQRNELQRLHSEIRHELELATRDAAVNERLRMLQRRSQLETPAASGKGSSAETRATSKKRTTLSTPGIKVDKSNKTDKNDKNKPKEGGTGFFGRFFGK
jgi:DNA repair exonuclease SbcCD ATPase subunit